MSLEDKLYRFLRIYEAAPQPLKTFFGTAYRAMPRRWRHGDTYDRFFLEASNADNWGADEIEAYQVAALRNSLVAAATAPAYARQFAEYGVDPSKFDSLDQLVRYPFLTKADLVSNLAGYLNPTVDRAQAMYITTGGSSGLPVGFYLQRGVSRPKEQAYFDVLWSRRGYEVGDRVAVIRGGVTTSSSSGKISYYDATRDWLILSSYHLTFDRLPEYIEALQKFQPRHLNAYPSSALLLARGLEQMGVRLEVPLTSVLCGSEKLTAESQEYIETIFGAPVLHWYGHSERVLLAGQGVRSNHLYFSPLYGYVEFGEENRDGCREIIGTTFHNHVMPLIRYRTGDFARFPAQARCELQGFEIESVVGRDYEFIVSHTGRKISLTAINMHDRVFDGLIGVQFYQRDPGIVEFRYQAGRHWNVTAVKPILSALQRKLGDDVTVTLRQVDEVAKTKAGKHVWLITDL